ncbi:hypothetical protein L1987_78639 [Smallanthus sonchifolius]|uniref:Uncharacterized protein n=1 Tax=Smallanthus sonchifolius TaxID=185202 RepID=A0ACB8ZEB7_9ASTR|nr:hypothetical protein L1987_78639 [Smallanthus sonchifolius]
MFIVYGSSSSDAAGGCNSNCEVDGYRNLMETQRVSDMMIAVAYFSIPIELLYFVTCSNVPFKWVLFEFIAFIVLCGMTHLLNWWTYEPHPFQLMLALTVFKFLTALVSFATAITLITLIPLLLKVKVRELMLRKKTRDLGREMGVIKKQEEAGLLGRAKSGVLMLRISMESGSHGRWATWKSNSSDSYVNVKFEIGIKDQLEGSIGDDSGAVEQSLSFGVCRKLVEMMQGKIWVVPYPVGLDQSMALVLRFQLGPSIAIGMLETGESSVLRGLQVLLAEEDEVNRAVTRKLLEKLGCIVSTVATGSDCFMALNHSYQMVILDLQMSDLDGFEVASRIRKSRSRNWPLIVGLTPNADENVWERCLQIGINGVIQKPVLLKGISDELRRVLDHTNNLH